MVITQDKKCHNDGVARPPIRDNDLEVVVEASLMVMVNHACNSCPGPPHHHHKQFIIAINSPIANVIILMTQQPQKSHSPQPQLQNVDCKGLVLAIKLPSKLSTHIFRF